MAARVFLHVGAPKSGTTFLQTVLWDNRKRLADNGVLVPGRTLFDFNRAATAVRKVDARHKKANSPGATWRRMLAETHAWPGTVVMSNEWFSLATAEDAQRALGRLDPSEVHIVFTARNFVAQVPAAWQETLKLGTSQPLPDFVAGLTAVGERWSWWTLDPAEVLARWGAILPADRVHVVTVPARGSEPGLLWKRFANVCGIDADAYDTEPGQANESLGAEAAALLQRLGPLLRAAIDADTAHWTEQYRWIRRYVGHDLLVPQGGSRIGLHAAEAEVLRQRAARTTAALVAAGYHVVGDLDELTEESPSGCHPDDVSAEAMLEVALTLTAQLMRRLRDETLRADQAEERTSPC